MISVDEKLRKIIENIEFNYVSADFSNPEAVGRIGESLKHCDITGCNRIYYLSTGFKFFPSIVQGLKKYGLEKEKKGFTRIVFEKPFGSGFKNSNELDKEIHKVFDEKDVFRIDHYLAKEGVKELVKRKLDDKDFRASLSSKKVKEIEVVSDEELGVGERLEYYNESGVLKDMIQNHLLQVLSLVLADFDNENEIHKKKIISLKNLKVVESKENLFGQYKSYLKEINFKMLTDSRRETFARIELESKENKWKGVKLILKSGKMLGKKESYVKIKFNDGKEKIFSISPAKKGRDEYSFLIEKAISNQKNYFASDEEVKECWRVVEDIEKMRSEIRFVRYEDGKMPF
jgi:glucose-6-phosphate 1-dehydrogenase